MNSMLRQFNLRVSDIKPYMRGFERSKPTALNDWAAEDARSYEPGHLLFCLEPVAAPTGLSSFSKKTEEQGETYRVKNLCIVISKDDGQCIAVNITASAFDFRVLDAL